MYRSQKILLFLILITSINFVGPRPLSLKPLGGPICYSACQTTAAAVCTATIIFFAPCYAAFQAACAVVLAGPASVPACEAAADVGCDALGPLAPVCFVAVQTACLCLFI